MDQKAMGVQPEDRLVKIEREEQELREHLEWQPLPDIGLVEVLQGPAAVQKVEMEEIVVGEPEAQRPAIDEPASHRDERSQRQISAVFLPLPRHGGEGRGEGGWDQSQGTQA